MATKLKQPNTKPRQFEIMVNFTQEHTDLAKGHLNSANAKQTSIQLWSRLAEDLNGNGPPTHTCVEWKKIWADYKSNIKAKLRKNKSNMSGTGGGPSKFCALTPLEEQVIEFLNMHESVDGISGILSFGGCSAKRVEDDAVQTTPQVPILENMNDSSASFRLSTPRQVSLPKGAEALLKLQVESQISYQEKSLQALSEISDSLKSISRYSRKKYELKEKKLALDMEKFEFKKKNEIEKTKLKTEKLAIKKRMLEIETERKQ